MFNHLWSILCKQSVVDATSNNLSLVDIYDEITVEANADKSTDPSKNPVGLPYTYEVVSLYSRDGMGEELSFNQRIEVLDPSKKVLGTFNHLIKFESTQDSVRAITKFNMIALTTSGKYTFKVYTSIDEKEEPSINVANIPIKIMLTLNGKKY